MTTASTSTNTPTNAPMSSSQATPSHIPVKRVSRRNAGGFVIQRRFDESSQGFKPLKAKVEGFNPLRARVDHSSVGFSNPLRARGERRAPPKELTIKIDTNRFAPPAPAPAPTNRADEDDFILVMGSSGAGKTSFINVTSGSRLPVSAGLKSCTSEVALSESFTLDGKRIRLIDTPGFDDSNRSDADVLGTISDFLAEEYKSGRKLQGILYFHRISDVRMGALSKRNFTMFQKLCGQHTYPNVVLVTSRWSEVNEHVGTGRENELKSKGMFFRPILEAGASLVRYERTIESAQGIIRKVYEGDRPPVTLTIQREMVVEGKTMAESQAGLALQSEKLASIQKFQENLRGLTQEIEVVKQENDVETQKELENDVRDLKDKVKDLEEENFRLISRQNSSEWEILPPSKEIPSDSVSFEVQVQPYVQEIPTIPSEASTAVPTDIPTIPSAISISAPTESLLANIAWPKLRVETDRLGESVEVAELPSPFVVGALPRGCRWSRETRKPFLSIARSLSEPPTNSRRTSVVEAASTSEKGVPECVGNMKGRDPGNNMTSITWGEWFFGFPPSMFMTVSYLLGGIIGPTD